MVPSSSQLPSHFSLFSTLFVTPQTQPEEVFIGWVFQRLVSLLLASSGVTDGHASLLEASDGVEVKSKSGESGG